MPSLTNVRLQQSVMASPVAARKHADMPPRGALTTQPVVRWGPPQPARRMGSRPAADGPWLGLRPAAERMGRTKHG
jgi:hypothetical protein